MPTIGTSCFSPGRRTSPRPPGGFFVTRRTSSAYPSNTERERGVAFRARRPVCALMRAGKRLFEAFRRAGRFGLGPREQSGDIGEEDGGASPGAQIPRPDARRHRRIQPRYPEGAVAPDPGDTILGCRLDLMPAGLYYKPVNAVHFFSALDDRLCLAVSDGTPARRFPGDYPAARPISPPAPIRACLPACPSRSIFSTSTRAVCSGRVRPSRARCRSVRARPRATASAA